MKINHINAFITAVTRIELNLNLKNLSNFCFELEKTKEKNKLSNIGGFQSKNIDLTNKNIQPLLKEINIETGYDYVSGSYDSTYLSDTNT